MVFNLKNVKNKIAKVEQLPEQKFNCIVNRFLYTDEESGFCIFIGQLTEKEKDVNVTIHGKTLTGRKFAVLCNSVLMVHSVAEGQEVEIKGRFEASKNSDGVQFSATTVQECIPTKPKAIEIFLGSGKIKGIGPQIAKKIVQKHLTNTIHMLDNSIDELLDIPGITDKKLEKIKSSWQEWRELYEVVTVMKEYGIGDMASVKIYNHFGKNAVNIVNNTPYDLTDVMGIGFKTADKIALAIGVKQTDPNRIEKGILFALEDITEKGHTAYPKKDLIEKVKDLLGIEEHLILSKIRDLTVSEDIIETNVSYKVFDERTKTPKLVTEVGLAHAKIYNTEKRIANDLIKILHTPKLDNSERFKENLESYLEKNPNKLDESQLKAVKTIVENKVAILTGGPGTGKTHTLKSIIQFYTDNKKIIVDATKGLALNYSINLAAPTGRASQRMYESTGMESCTIHRLLGYNKGAFTFTDKNQLVGDVFILDESSMIDIFMGSSLIKAIPSTAQIIFVGDADQLASVGAGKFFKDLIESRVIPVARLTEIHRQARNSDIILASHDVINKRMPKLNDINSLSDFVFVEKNGNEDIHDEIINIVKNLLSKGISENDIQILTPKKETEVGVNQLNHSLRPILNVKYDDELSNQLRFGEGDRVMQFKNNSELDIFNGEIGLVKAIDIDNSEIFVQFNTKQIGLSGSDFNDLNYAYATTVHKSQGSDYPYVIIPMSKSHSFMWDANLLYTAMTRGKQRVILVGEKQTIAAAVSHYNQNDRITLLKDILIEELNLSYNQKKSNAPKLF